MTSDTQEIIREVQHKFNDLLDFVLIDARNTPVYEVECHILKQLLQLGCLLMKTYCQMRCSQYGREPLVGDDGQETPFWQEKERTFFSIFGKFKIARPYFYQREQGGHSPLDELLGLGDDIYSDMLRQMYEILSVHTTYEKAVAIMSRFLGVKLSTRVAQQFVSKDATDVVAYYDKKEAPAVESEAEILVAQADGKGVPLVKTQFDGQQKIEKKEAVVTSIYTIGSTPRSVEDVMASFFDETVSHPQRNETGPTTRMFGPRYKAKRKRSNACRGKSLYERGAILNIRWL